MVVRPQRDKWVADVITASGDRKRKTFATREEAEAFEIANAKPDISVGTIFETAFNKFWKGTKDERMARSIVHQLIEGLGPTKEMTTIKTKTIVEYVDRLQTRDGLSNGTINRKLAKLSKILTYAHDREIISELPKVEFLEESEGRIRFLSREEEALVLDRLAEKYRQYATFLLYVGCRVSEALNLRWEHIQNGRVSFWKTKGKKPRTVPLHPKAIAVLEWTRAQGWKTPFEGINYDAFYDAWNVAKTKAGLGDEEDFVPHALRHTFASRLAVGGTDIYRIKELLGHSSVKVTERYMHLIPQNLDSALAALDRDS